MMNDVMCKCGYMASQHWANGDCPGDGYPYQDAPENHVDIRKLMTRLEKAHEALELCRHPDVVGYWSAEEVTARYFAEWLAETDAAQ